MTGGRIVFLSKDATDRETEAWRSRASFTPTGQFRPLTQTLLG